MKCTNEIVPRNTVITKSEIHGYRLSWPWLLFTLITIESYYLQGQPQISCDEISQ